MKNLLHLFISLILALSIAACGKKGEGVETIDNSLGGTVSVDDPNSPIYGAKVVIKPDTLDADAEVIRIGHEDALPGELPAQAQAHDAIEASKTLVLTRDGTSDFALPVEVTLPFDKNIVGANDVPLVLFHDETTGKYSAVALSAVDRNAGNVTFRTAHFSKFVVIVLRAVADSLGMSQPSVDTGFRTNADDFFVKNFGTYDSPNGSCLGMANYSTWYFDNKKAVKGVGLQTLYKQGEPTVEEDDQNVRELISRAYMASSQYWAKEAMRAQFAQGEVFTGTYLIQTMLATGAPQVLLMSDAVPIADFGHAVTVYRYDADNLRFEIYDNNFPREVVYLPWNPITGFGSYPKYGGDANEFAFDAWHSSFSPATFEALYNGIEGGWSSTKFAQITMTQPPPSASDATLLISESETNVTLAGVVPRIPGEDNPNAARYAHIYLEGSNKAGVAPVDDAGNFNFVIGALPNPDGTDVMILVSESSTSWRRGFRAFKQATVRTADDALFALTVNISGEGRLTSQPAGIDCFDNCSATYNDGTEVTLTAAPANGYLFSGWSGSCNGAALECTLSLTQARTVGATFSPATGGWSGPSVISAGASGGAKVAMDNDGNALLIWQQRDDGFGQQSIWASYYTPATGWSSPSEIENNTGDTRDLHLAMDPTSGRAIAAWQQLTSERGYDVWARPFDPTTGWGTLATIDNVNESPGKITVGVDAGGNGVAVWSQLEAQYSPRISIYANRYTHGSGWGTARMIENESELGRIDGDPSLYVAPNGNALAVWTGSGGSSARRGIWTNQYTAGADWASASQLIAREDIDAFAVTPPFIAGDGAGNALLTFGQLNVEGGQSLNLLNAKRYQGGWQTPNNPIAPTFNNGSVIAHPYISLSAEGTALAVWGHTNSTRLSASFGSGAGTWSAPAIINTGTREVRSIPTFAVDNQGNAVVGWSQANDLGTTDVWVAQYNNGEWTVPSLHENTIETATDPTLDVNARGNAVMAWTQYMGSTVGTQIIVRHYTSGR